MNCNVFFSSGTGLVGHCVVFLRYRRLSSDHCSFELMVLSLVHKFWWNLENIMILEFMESLEGVVDYWTASSSLLRLFDWYSKRKNIVMCGFCYFISDPFLCNKSRSSIVLSFLLMLPKHVLGMSWYNCYYGCVHS